MKKYENYKFTVAVLIMLIFVMGAFTLIYYNYFIKTKEALKHQTFEYLLKEVNSVTKNIERYNKSIYGDLKEYLFKHPQEREKYNLYLSSFITSNYKNLFIVYKDKYSKFFRAIADGTINKEDRFDFNEKFEPKFYEKWMRVLKIKKPVYFKTDIKGIWTTYLYPVLKKGRVNYIIVIDFSTKPLSMIEKNLKFLKELFVRFIIFIIIVVFILSVFIYYDVRRQMMMKKLLLKISDLNKNLQKRVEEEVKKSREKDKQLILQSRLALMGELLSMIAHQWRQPLNVLSSIVSNIEFDLKFGEIDKKELEKSVKKMKETIYYLSNTIDDFRKFYRDEKDKQLVEIKEVLDEIMSIIKSSLNNKNISLIVKNECKNKIYIRKNDLKQVLLNLIKNAEDILIERNIKSPKVEIIAFEEGGKCIIEIRDNAGGVDEKIKDKIFEPYFTTKDEKNGTGLGLYMSKNIVEKRLDGTIYEYNSEEGAVFRIELKVGK